MANAVFNTLTEQTRSMFHTFFQKESAGGVVLLVCALVALVVANVPALQPLHRIWMVEFGVEAAGNVFRMPLILWVNDALMAVFFFNVGLEIKREMLVGELAQPRQAMLPIFGAVGGMLFPAIIYLLFNRGTECANGWGIPMATDIAFAIGVLAILGSRCPLGLKVFLTALAIVDDLGAIIVLAIFYPSHAISFIYLGYAAGILVLLFMMNRALVNDPGIYVIVGIVLWYFIFKSGIHATIAGVLLAVFIPSRTKINEVRFYTHAESLVNQFKSASNGEVDVFANPAQLNAIHLMQERVNAINPLMTKFETILHKWVSFFIMPVFALANAGVTFGDSFSMYGLYPTLANGIFFGLMLGKPLGIFTFSWLAVKMRMAQLPEGVKWKQLFAIGILGGIGFTMSLFVDGLAFTDIRHIQLGKAAVIVTSVVTAIVGMLVVMLTSKKVKSININTNH